jgi:hypothetical protein
MVTLLTNNENSLQDILQSVNSNHEGGETHEIQ